MNVTSESYRFRNPFQIYQTTKLALEGLSDVMRRELAPLGVPVSTVRPGAIETELFHAMDRSRTRCRIPGSRRRSRGSRAMLATSRR